MMVMIVIDVTARLLLLAHGHPRPPRSDGQRFEDERLADRGLDF
jgi:hypothetical protein